jgi:hypothetical protein
MKNKTIEEIIEVPVDWLSQLAILAENAEHKKDTISYLIGFASSAKILLKYGKRKENDIL